MTRHIILGSSSPQRRALLEMLIPPAQIDIISPDVEERDLSPMHEWTDIVSALAWNARAKADAVTSLAHGAGHTIVCADTTIVGNNDGELHCLEKPPARNWQPVVRSWFEKFYCGKSHYAVTGVVVRRDGADHECVVKTEVEFRNDTMQWVPWYLSTGESVGKAGGYGIQGAASLFVQEIRGSLTNIVGLPLLETGEILGLPLPTSKVTDKL